jgi:hypothetical protein
LFTLLVHEDKSNIQNFSEDRILFNKFFNVVTKNTLTPNEQKESIEIAKKMLSRMNEDSKATLGFSELPPEVFITIFSMIPSLQGFLNSNPESYLTQLTRLLRFDT